MSSRLARLTPALSMALVLGALLACKKKKEAEPEAAPSAAVASAAPQAASAPAPASAAPAAEPTPTGPKLGDVKRYPEKEKKADDAAVKILEADVKVFNEADAKTQEVATLPKDLVVVRLATIEQDGFTLVDFPSGIGQFSPGWVETKFLEAKGEQTTREKVLAQTKTASVSPSAKPASSAAPKSSAAPSTSAALAAAAKSAAPLVSAAASAAKIDPKVAASAAKALPVPTTTSTSKKKKKSSD